MIAFPPPVSHPIGSPSHSLDDRSVPRYTKHYEDGHGARYAGKPAWHNPNLARSDEYVQWDAGWRSADHVLSGSEMN